VVVSAATGDAITNAALELRERLRRGGPSELFAAFIDPALGGEAYPLGEFPRVAGGADLLVVHVSIGEPLVAAFLSVRPEPMAVVYHNMSPAAAFDGWDDSFAGLLREGRRWLGGLANRARVGVAVSEYSAAELLAAGFQSVAVAPLPVRPRLLLHVRPDEAMTAQLDGLDGPVVLCVGQLMPHKRQDWLLMAFHALVTHLLPSAWLVLVGPERLPPYASALRGLVASLNLNRAFVFGQVSQASLVACYRRASVFMTASEHEGFCVPLLEAMAFGVPVVARDFAAVPETLAGAGLVLGAGDGLLVAAEALRAVLCEPLLAASLAHAGRERLARLGPRAATSALLGALLSAPGEPLRA
jgi:glycosyltransferase involved in cell wall biosynthesis